MGETCEICGGTDDVESVQVYGGRDYPPRPPEYRDLCSDCREEREPDEPQEPEDL